MVYCDPPYAGTTGYDAAGAWDPERFWVTMEAWSARGAVVLVSEYEAPAGWTAVWSKDRRMDMRDTTGGQRVVRDRLFQFNLEEK